MNEAGFDVDLKRYQRQGLLILAALFVVVFVWGGFAQIAGAVIAPGRVAVESAVKRVQHQGGGIVSEVLVREGDRVAAGQVLLRLDPTVAEANAQMADKQYLELTARRLRLEAERDGRERIDVSGLPASPALAATVSAEERLMRTRRQARLQKEAQLRQQISQSGSIVEGLRAQLASNAAQAELIQGELKGIRDLYAKGLAPLSRLNALEREAKRLDGERGQFTSDIARTQAHASEIELQILQVESDYLSEVMADLKDTTLRLSQTQQQKITDDDALQRIEIRSPVAGHVQQLAVHTRGGVIAPGETLMIVVPEGDRLIVEARVDPQHVDQVRAGAVARVRFTSFSSATTPEIVGRVERISSDVQTDEKTGVSFYVARCALRAPSLPVEIRSGLIPGMPAEVHIETGSHNALSYFMKPFSDQLARAFRED